MPLARSTRLGAGFLAVPVGCIGAFVDNGRDTTLTDVTLGGITGPFNAVVPRHVPTTAAAVLFTNGLTHFVPIKLENLASESNASSNDNNTNENTQTDLDSDTQLFQS